MNKQERSSFLSKCLYDVFREQFYNFQKDIEAEAIKLIPKKFIELMSDEDSKEFVSAYSLSEIKIITPDESTTVLVCQPIYGLSSYMPGSYLSEKDKRVVERLKITNIKVPYKLTTTIIINIDLFNRYLDLWDRYLKAREQLQSLCFSYRSRDKFAADFPEYKKYLPPKVVITKLPTVIVDDVRNSLSALGVPPTDRPYIKDVS